MITECKASKLTLPAVFYQLQGHRESHELCVCVCVCVCVCNCLSIRGRNLLVLHDSILWVTNRLKMYSRFFIDYLHL